MKILRKTYLKYRFLNFIQYNLRLPVLLDSKGQALYFEKVNKEWGIFIQSERLRRKKSA